MALIAEIVGGTYVAFDALDTTGMFIGQQIIDASSGDKFVLANSDAQVDHVTVEAVLGNPQLRWVKDSGGSVEWLSQQQDHAASLGLGIDCVPYFDDFGIPVAPSGEFTQSPPSTYAQWLAGTVVYQAQHPSGVFLIDSGGDGSPADNLAFIWSQQACGVLNDRSWYVCSRVQPQGGLATTPDTQRILVGACVSWDFVQYAMLTEVQGTFTLNLNNQLNVSNAISGGTCDLTAAHDYAVVYDHGTDTVTAYCDRKPIPGLASIPNAGQYLPSDPSNEGGTACAVFGNGSAPMLADKLAFLTESL